ncbi:MAG: 30S ribosomal protein S17 [Candidatus Woesearchaeota archaeon]
MVETCKDKHCAKHGSIRTHGRTFTATVLSARAQNTAIVEWERRYYVPKYERYERRRTKINAHNPECINAKPGDIVRISECRPVSKTKHFVITEKIGAERLFEERAAMLEEAKVKKKEVPEKAEEKT